MKVKKHFSVVGRCFETVPSPSIVAMVVHSIAYLNLGTSLIALGRCQEAASVLREGSKLDGTGLRDRPAHENARISALLQLGNLYADQGKLQRALAIYREALHTLPERYPPQTAESESLPHPGPPSDRINIFHQFSSPTKGPTRR
uniref:TPR_REGION domain-containing protein n=1 Tax=Anopheles albimanus TaxID=7167 RepID=A0A182F5G1_ANOAL